MRFRKLRIAWSASFGVVGLLLIGLWVRSYYYSWDVITVPVLKNTGLAFKSNDGRFHVWPLTAKSGKNLRWSIRSDTPVVGGPQGRMMDREIHVWYSGPVFIIAALAIAPWASDWGRFSLRTLLIATTLVAVVLGIIASM